VILLHRNEHILLIFQWSLNRRSEDARFNALREAALTKAKFSIKRQIAAQSTCFDCGSPWTNVDAQLNGRGIWSLTI
jgi:hypothetical protein